jgi:hypothetical protein
MDQQRSDCLRTKGTLPCSLSNLRDSRLKKGFSSIIKGDFFNEFTLMGFASLTAIGLGDIAEAAGVMLFIRSANYSRSVPRKNHANRSKAYWHKSPPPPLVLRNGVATEIAPEEVQKGDTIS